MLKAGIFVDSENVMRNGGWGMRYDVLKKVVESQGPGGFGGPGTVVVRANAYLASDFSREHEDPAYRQKKESYRSKIRSCGFRLSLKAVKRYYNEDGGVVTKANTDLEMAVDALLQSRSLDYVVLVTGDGDFVGLVKAIQTFGVRVDVISFHNTSKELRHAADYHSFGFVIPDLIPVTEGKTRGVLVSVDEERFFGHIAVMKSYLSYTDNVFCHGTNFVEKVSNKEFSRLCDRHAIVEFKRVMTAEGPQAHDIEVLKPE